MKEQKITSDYVSEYLEKHMPIKESDLTLLKLANRIKKQYGLIVKPKTIMGAIARELEEKYNTTWDELAFKTRIEQGAHFTLYIVGSTGYKNKEYIHYLKVGLTRNDRDRISAYRSHNPGIIFLSNYYYSGKTWLTDELLESLVRTMFRSICKGEDIENQITEWFKVDKEVFEKVCGNAELSKSFLENAIKYYTEDKGNKQDMKDLELEDFLKTRIEYDSQDVYLRAIDNICKAIWEDKITKDDYRANYNLKLYLKYNAKEKGITEEQVKELYNKYSIK